MGLYEFVKSIHLYGAASHRIADILVCNVSTRKYARVVNRGADALGLSKSAVSRAFVKETGIAPMTFVELARVDRAKALLETSDWPLARIAERAGFGSLDGLHRAFQKRVRATPGEYRDRFGRHAAAGA